MSVSKIKSEGLTGETGMELATLSIRVNLWRQITEEVGIEANPTLSHMNGFAVATFTSPLKALGASVSHKPDLLLSDFKMHGMDGLTLATKLTERHPTCKVLIMSGNIHDATTHPALKRFELLQKPVPLPRLPEKIAETLGD